MGALRSIGSVRASIISHRLAHLQQIRTIVGLKHNRNNQKPEGLISDGPPALRDSTPPKKNRTSTVAAPREGDSSFLWASDTRERRRFVRGDDLRRPNASANPGYNRGPRDSASADSIREQSDSAREDGFAQRRQHKSRPLANSASNMTTEGVLAITKPKGISSAQVIRDVQSYFDPSELFKPWLAQERARREREAPHEKRKRSRAKRELKVKIGHGGTLDPMATGVLVLGFGAGTKALQAFMTECNKSYETVVLFGAATDTYDMEGKVLSRKPYEHITREIVEKALEQFRGKGKQKPPIYSALRVNGKRFYEYAREGKEIPIEIKERDVDVSELELMEWSEGGTHEWHWPDREAEAEEKAVAKKVLHIDSRETTPAAEQTSNGKRKLEAEADPTDQIEVEPSMKRMREDDSAVAATSTNVPLESGTGSRPPPGSDLPTTQTVDPASSTEAAAASRSPCPAPACRIRMNVTSGFYVRSFCHDLGAAVGSLGMMANLVRTRQGEFELGKNVLDYDVLKEGEDVWAPKVSALLKEWNARIS